VTYWWDNGDKQIAYCRGGKGFIAFNDQLDTDFEVTLQVNITTKSMFEPLSSFSRFPIYHQFTIILYIICS
jgi:hypothetical protein